MSEPVTQSSQWQGVLSAFSESHSRLHPNAHRIISKQGLMLYMIAWHFKTKEETDEILFLQRICPRPGLQGQAFTHLGHIWDGKAYKATALKNPLRTVGWFACFYKKFPNIALVLSCHSQCDKLTMLTFSAGCLKVPNWIADEVGETYQFGLRIAI